MRDPLKRIVVLAAILTVPLAACGGDDDGDGGEPDGPPPADTVAVEALDTLVFDESAYESAPGLVAFELENGGALPHTLVIEDVEDFKLSVNGSGATDDGSVELEPGDYVLFCDVAGHRDAGMEATLEVG